MLIRAHADNCRLQKHKLLDRSRLGQASLRRQAPVRVRLRRKSAMSPDHSRQRGCSFEPPRIDLRRISFRIEGAAPNPFNGAPHGLAEVGIICQTANLTGCGLHVEVRHDERPCFGIGGQDFSRAAGTSNKRPEAQASSIDPNIGLRIKARGHQEDIRSPIRGLKIDNGFMDKNNVL